MKEVDTTKGTGHDGVDLGASTADTDLSAATDMREDVTLAQFDES